MPCAQLTAQTNCPAVTENTRRKIQFAYMYNQHYKYAKHTATAEQAVCNKCTKTNSSADSL